MNSTNKNIVLVMGKPNTGKSASLMKLRNQQKMVYLNTDLKELPFPDNFMHNVEIADARDVLGYVEEIEQNGAVEGAILDTLTFLMSMYERQYVANAANGQKAWGQYATFYGDFIHAIKSGTKDYAILAHAETSHDEEAMRMDTRVPVKGSVGRTGVEADFTTILTTKQIPVSRLEGQENDLLHITDDEREDGLKYVFCTRVNKDTLGEKTRSAIGLWKREELYIDNDLDQVFARLKQYYGTTTKAAA